MNKKLLTTSVFLATSIAMAFEPWIGSSTPTPYYVNTGLDNGTNTAGYWFVKDDHDDGGESKVVWPVATGDNSAPDFLAPIIESYGGVYGTANLNKGTLTYNPFVSVGFNVAGEDAHGALQAGDASEWGGICITYRSDVAPSLELSMGVDTDASIGYALPAASLNKSINGESYKKCIPWSDFNQPSWHRGVKISGTEAAAQLVSINFKMQGSPGQYKFNICTIGPYYPKDLTMHPEISVSAEWSKGNNGYNATITVKDGKKELTKGTDYEIETSVNDATGIVIKTITGKGDYAGSVVKSLVPYIDENGEPQVMYDATVLTNNKDGVTELSGGWYVATGKVNMAGIKFNGDAHLILADDATLDVEASDNAIDAAIEATENLTIYGQSNQNGILKASATKVGVYSDGIVTIGGGTVEATGNEIGIFSYSDITISGGTVKATSEYGGIVAYNGVTISGGTVEATSNEVGIYSISDITISGGTVEVTGEYGGIVSEEGIITLDWTNDTDRIKASSYYSGSVQIAEGKSLKDEKGNVYSGTLTKGQVSDLEGQKLEPFEGNIVSFVNNFGETSVVFAKIAIDGEGNVAAPAKHPIRTGYTFAGWFTAPKGGSKFDFTATVNTTAYAHWNENTTSVEYIDENGKTQILEPGDYTVLTNDIYVEDLPEGWYVVEGEVKYTSTVLFSGNAHLILADGAKMEIESEGGDGIDAWNNLTIYGQSGQSGILITTATGDFGIYSNSYITISGGTVTATGTDHSGIYSNSYITINDGTVTATGGDNGIYSYEGVSISGGTVTATGNYGIDGNNGVTISGGSVTATGDNNGIYSQNGNITLSWTNSTDFIKASSYMGHVKIAEGKSFKDENGKAYSGTIDPVSDIAGKTLVPSSFKGKFLSDVNVAVADIPVQKYADGKPVCPSVVVTDGKDTLKAGTDYTVACSNNTAVTSATLDEAAIAQITGKGNYAGAIQKRFFIWNNIRDYAAVQVYKDKKGDSHAEIDGAYDGTDAAEIDEDFENVAVKFNREFSVNLENGGFSTIMLPFDVSASNLTGVKSIFKFDDVNTDESGKKTVGVNYVWCNETIGEEEGKVNPNRNCNKYSGELKAYTPYMVEMETPTLGINGNVTLKSSNNATNSVVSKSNWVFRGALEKKEWSKEDDDIKNGQIWAFAGSARNGASIGKFVQFGGNNWVNPFRAYLVDCTTYPDASECKDETQPEPSFVSRYRFADVLAPTTSAENSLSAKKPMGVAASETALLNSMDIVIVYGDSASGERPTVIGRMNPATGEIRMLPRTTQTYDLKGRRVNSEKRNARGAYYGKHGRK